MATENGAERAGGFEKELQRLERTVEKLESEMPGLDEALKLYEEGVRSLKACQKRLAEAEGRIRMLVESAGAPELRDFEPGEDASDAQASTASTSDAQDEAASDAETKPRRSRRRRGGGTGLF